MRSIIEVCAIGAILACAAGAQEPAKPQLRAGVSVEMPVAGHAVEMRAADEEDAMVVALTADGRVFAGVRLTDPDALSKLTAETVYVKADSRAPYQKVLAVLDALRGKSVVLLTAPPSSAAKAGMAPPYGIRLTVSR